MDGMFERCKLFYRYGGSFIGTMADTSKWPRMYQSPKLEFVVNQDCWWSAETGFADIILPACTPLERDDIGEWGEPGGQTKGGSSGCNFRVIVRMKKCIEPLWESKSDYQIFSLLARSLGPRAGLYGREFRDRLGAQVFRDFRSAEAHFMGGVRSQRATTSSMSRRITAPTPALRWYAEGRACDTPDPNNPKRLTDQGPRTRYLQRQD